MAQTIYIVTTDKYVDSQEGLQFDYKIRKGVTNNRNAIRLLEYLGYPDVIVQAAEKQITG
ncbi:hypothetical protein [Clostridium thermarum]|uniref:hypothetical protein n=1 Tax=Clostridium thermarum TaxID=1716543 RepID=UPI0013D6DD52|nr:hypothetical protein [Clostridium thermarum]